MYEVRHGFPFTEVGAEVPFSALATFANFNPRLMFNKENQVDKTMDGKSASFQKCFIYLLYHYKYTNAEQGNRAFW